MYKNFKLTEQERQQILESHKSHGYKQPLNEQPTKENKVVPCSSLGIKTIGYCDIQQKKPVKPCAKLGVKTMGYCYVDTKEPVPGVNPKTLNEDDSNNKGDAEYIKMKFFDNRIEEFGDEMRNLIDDAQDNFFNWKGASFDADMESDDNFIKMVDAVINKIESMASQLRAEYLEREPSDDDIYNQPGSEGGISYKNDNDNFQGR